MYSSDVTYLDTGDNNVIELTLRTCMLSILLSGILYIFMLNIYIKK